jgi:hypothetical protein
MVSQIAKCWRTFAKCSRTFAKCSRTFGSIVFKCSRVFAFFKNSRTFEMFASVCRIYAGSTTVLFLHDFIHTPFLSDSLVCFLKLGSTRSRTFEIAHVRFWCKNLGHKNFWQKLANICQMFANIWCHLGHHNQPSWQDDDEGKAVPLLLISCLP